MTGSANVDLVRSILAATERGELLQPADWAHPEIEWVVVDGPQPGRWRGLAGMAKSVRDSLAAWDDVRVYADECRELDDKRVLALFRRTGRGKTSGLEVGELDTRGASVYHVRDGTVTKVINYNDRDRALVELGLAPEGGAP